MNDFNLMALRKGEAAPIATSEKWIFFCVRKKEDEIIEEDEEIKSETIKN
jgi:hypothetical protein